MQDIRKPYTRSRSRNNLEARLERFQESDYGRNDYDDEPVRIPSRSYGHDSEIHHRRPYEERAPISNIYPERDTVYRQNGARISRKISTRSLLSFSLAGVVVVVVFLYTFVFNSATITIVPKYKDLNDFNKVVTFSKENENSTQLTFTEETKSISKTKKLEKSETRSFGKDYSVQRF
jgi:hypothetical protein